jgi:hypothetical protein
MKDHEKKAMKERLKLLQDQWGLMAEDDGRGNHVPPTNPVDIIAQVMNDLAAMAHELACNVDDGHGSLDSPLTLCTDIDGLDAFTRAYMECALWSSNDESDPSGGKPLDENYSIESLSHEAWCEMIADCAKFQEENVTNLRICYGAGKTPSNAGHDFFLTRNGHGAGFWDGDWPKPLGEYLSNAAKAFGEVHLYVEDDKIYQE